MAKKLGVFETPFETYTELEFKGQGGSGRVCSVKSSSGETFALKYLDPEKVSTEKLKRFKNEIGFCQRNSHPNIVSVVDTGAVVVKEVKCPFYVMKLYSGTLRSFMENKLVPDNVMRLFSQILDGVEAAHLAGVWHRDLKPENVLWDRVANSVVIADFGIAHFEEEAIYTAVETKVASRMANFQYSAPEQRVRNALVDKRSDIFALGLMLNELFTREILQGAGYRKIFDVKPEYGYLDEIVEAMTQQNPANRLDSIETIKKELIGRKAAFIALQKFDEVKKQTVKASEPPQFEPVKIMGLDYTDDTLRLQLSRNVPPGWTNEFHQQRGGHTSVLGYGPDRFTIGGNEALISVRNDEKLIQDIINYAKQYTDTANRLLVEQMPEAAALEERRQKIALEKQVADAQLRKNILSNIKL